MIDKYRKTLLQVPVLPLFPKDQTCRFGDIYIRPKITSEIKGEKGKTEEKEIETMSEIFTKNGDRVRSVYVVGDAGTGKSSFCKYLVHCWCMAHSEEYQTHSMETENDKIETDNGKGKDCAHIICDETNEGEFCADNKKHDVGHETNKTELGDGNEELHVKADKERHLPLPSMILPLSPRYYFDTSFIDKLKYDYKESEIKFNGVREMRKFDFMFHIDLRRYQNVVSIHEMLKKHYKSEILEKLLEKDSAKIIILLDGLDEWSSNTVTNNQYQTEGLPEQEYFKNYTVVTTSRPWKIHTLGVSDTEMQKLLKLKGFDTSNEMLMIYRTVSFLNSQKGKSKGIADCLIKMGEKSVRSLKQVPIMLQQLICLWFDDKLDNSSRCAVYTGMLELIFTWNVNKGTGKRALSPMKIVLPQYLATKQKCKSHSNLIYDLSRLAYETLFKCTKDKSLTFDISVFEQLEISDEIRENCLKLGILTEDKCPSIYVSEPPSSMFSFIHKSVQEYLAAVNIAINFKLKINSPGSSKEVDLDKACIQFVKDVFKNGSTVNEILEQSNVIIMLCGLEPRLATHVSRCIYDNVQDDPLVKRYRRTIGTKRYPFIIVYGHYNSDVRCIIDLQDLILNSLKECNEVCHVENFPTFYIGDLFISSRNEFCDTDCSSIDQYQINPDCVHSIYVDIINTENDKLSKYLSKFKHLDKILIGYDTLRSSSTKDVEHSIDEVNNSVVETIKISASTLKSLCLNGSYNYKLYTLGKEIVCIIPSMTSLASIRIIGITMGHDDTCRLCESLERTGHLEQIYIDVECECRKQHDVDLSKQQQLQYLYIDRNMCITGSGIVNLEVFTCKNIDCTNHMKIFDFVGKCGKLKELCLCLDNNNKSQSNHTSITERLVSVLPLLHNLSELNLCQFRLTDNIIQAPSEMKSLKSISLIHVILSLTKCRKFVDSVTSIPHPVLVMLLHCCITGDGEECTYNTLSLGRIGGEKIDEVIQYVKCQEQLFNVRDDSLLQFRFSTKK